MSSQISNWRLTEFLSRASPSGATAVLLDYHNDACYYVNQDPEHRRLLAEEFYHVQYTKDVEETSVIVTEGFGYSFHMTIAAAGFLPRRLASYVRGLEARAHNIHVSSHVLVEPSGQYAICFATAVGAVEPVFVPQRRGVNSSFGSVYQVAIFGSSGSLLLRGTQPKLHVFRISLQQPGQFQHECTVSLKNLKVHKRTEKRKLESSVVPISASSSLHSGADDQAYAQAVLTATAPPAAAAYALPGMHLQDFPIVPDLHCTPPVLPAQEADVFADILLGTEVPAPLQMQDVCQQEPMNNFLKEDWDENDSLKPLPVLSAGPALDRSFVWLDDDEPPAKRHHHYLYDMPIQDVVPAQQPEEIQMEVLQLLIM